MTAPLASNWSDLRMHGLAQSSWGKSQQVFENNKIVNGARMEGSPAPLVRARPELALALVLVQQEPGLGPGPELSVSF